MPAVNFNLKDPDHKTPTLIYLIFRYKGRKLKSSTKESINPKYWNSKKQRVKPTYTGSGEFNMYLEKLERNMLSVYRKAIADGTNPSPDYLRQQLNNFINTPLDDKDRFLDIFDEFLEVSKASRKAGTIMRFKVLRGHLVEFQNKKKFNLSFDTIDLKFSERFTAYCINEKKLLNNTTNKYIKTFKVFLRWAADRGYHSNTTFTKFKTPDIESDIIYLTEKELMQLYTHDLSDNPTLAKVRDTFCFGCFTGQRWSDIAGLKREHIKGSVWHLHTQKTDDDLLIPLNDFAINILKRHKNDKKILPIISNQKMNQYLKDLGEEAEIDEPISITKYRGTEKIVTNEPKYKFMTTHTARRTFVTLSLEKGMRVETVMEITGHKDYKTLKKYIKITNKVKQVEMNRIWSAPADLKVVS